MLIKVPVRHFGVYPFDKPEDYVESNNRYTVTTWEIETEEAALVLVDVWNKHPLKSHMQRIQEIITEKIAPLVQVVRRSGVTVIHAPSPEIAKKYPQWTRHADDEDANPTPEKSDWPPTDFQKRTGKYEKYNFSRSNGGYKGPLQMWDDIAESVKPKPEDFVIATGNQLHRLLRDKKVLHLFYAGFAANLCLHFRDYGMDAMRKRGYNLILLRDCTTARETSYTVGALSITEVEVQNIEMLNSSTTSEELIKACEAALKPS